MKIKKLLALTSFFSGLAVIFGAFGAHGLQKLLSTHLMDVFQTGVRYQFYHCFGLFIYLLWVKSHDFKNNKENRPQSLFPAYFFLAGIILFSGSLYLLAILNMPKLGMITPIGGLCFIIGWFSFSFQIYNYKCQD